MSGNEVDDTTYAYVVNFILASPEESDQRERAEALRTLIARTLLGGAS